MTEKEQLSLMAIAQNHKSNEQYDEALSCYNTIYQSYLEGHEYYDYLSHYNRYTFYSSRLYIDGEEIPLLNWATVRVIHFLDIVNKYIECLILRNNPKFISENSEAYRRMIHHNVYQCKKEKGKWNVITTNPYPFTFKILYREHIFKAGSLKGVPLWEVEQTTPTVILSMIQKVPTESSDSQLDLAVYMQFFLSKYRTRDKNFYNALETNYAKMKASKVWQHRLETVIEEESIRNEGDSYDAHEDFWKP